MTPWGSTAFDYVKSSTESDDGKVVGFATETDAGNAVAFATESDVDNAVKSATESDADKDADKSGKSATETNADLVVESEKTTETKDVSGIWRDYAETVMRFGQDNTRCRDGASSCTTSFYKRVCLEETPQFSGGGFGCRSRRILTSGPTCR